MRGVKLQTKFIVVGLFSAAIVIAMVLTSNVALDGATKQVAQQRMISAITQRHMEGDMMHDAIRADVLSALLAYQSANLQEIESIEADMIANMNNFYENVDENRNSAAPADLKAEFEKLHGWLQEYDRSARAVIAAAKRGADPQLYITSFNAAHQKLMDENKKITDQIELWSHAEEAGARNQAGQFNELSYILSIIAAGSSLFVAYYAWHAVFRPQNRLIEAMQALAGEQLDIEIPDQHRKDEIGEMARALEVFKQNAVHKRELEQEHGMQEKRAQQERRDAREKLANAFESRVESIIHTVASAATELYHTAESMSGLINNVLSKSSSVSGGARKASDNVQNIASAAEEMSASAQEIAQQISKSVSVVETAVGEVDNADHTSQSLRDMGDKIGNIISLIQSIAGQINLLALNATIESARAGEAGRGFAVVASEVKGLAGQTANATEEIAVQVRSIQNVARQVVTALSSIKDAISQVAQYASAISAAVEEQSATTSEIAANMSVAANGTTNITADIEEVMFASNEAHQASDQVLTAAKMLSKEAEKLSLEVSMFLSEIRNN